MLREDAALTGDDGRAGADQLDEHAHLFPYMAEAQAFGSS